MNYLYFIAGAVAGAAVSYFVTRKVERKHADEQIEAVKAKLTEIKNDNEILKNARKNSDINLEKPYDEIAKSPAANNDIDYTKFAKKPESPKKKEKDPKIKAISENEYFTYINNKSYSEAAFTFYQGDGSLVDEESGMIVIDPEKYVGPSGVDAMKEASVEEIYYVDEIDEIINCITISEDSYYGNDEYDE